MRQIVFFNLSYSEILIGFMDSKMADHMILAMLEEDQYQHFYGKQTWKL